MGAFRVCSSSSGRHRTVRDSAFERSCAADSNHVYHDSRYLNGLIDVARGIQVHEFEARYT